MLDEKGFTLIEVISAVAILGISLGLIMSLFASGASTAKVTQDYSRALTLAKEKLNNRIISRDETFNDGSSGRANGYEWELRETPFTGLQGFAGSESLRLQRVEVRIRWNDGNKRKETALYGLRMTERHAKEENI